MKEYVTANLSKNELLPFVKEAIKSDPIPDSMELIAQFNITVEKLRDRNKDDPLYEHWHAFKPCCQKEHPEFGWHSENLHYGESPLDAVYRCIISQVFGDKFNHG